MGLDRRLVPRESCAFARGVGYAAHRGERARAEPVCFFWGLFPLGLVHGRRRRRRRRPCEVGLLVARLRLVYAPARCGDGRRAVQPHHQGRRLRPGGAGLSLRRSDAGAAAKRPCPHGSGTTAEHQHQLECAGSARARHARSAVPKALAKAELSLAKSLVDAFGDGFHLQGRARDLLQHLLGPHPLAFAPQLAQE